jgi:hypothetical protein
MSIQAADAPAQRQHRRELEQEQEQEIAGLGVLTEATGTKGLRENEVCPPRGQGSSQLPALAAPTIVHVALIPQDRCEACNGATPLVAAPLRATHCVTTAFMVGSRSNPRVRTQKTDIKRGMK